MTLYWHCPTCGTVDGQHSDSYCTVCRKDGIDSVVMAMVHVKAVADRLRNCADVIDARDVSRTARTLNRAADLIEAEFGIVAT